MEFVAHRAGNSTESLLAATRRECAVELDVHLGRHGTIEVRHAKLLRPTRRLWERWYVLPADTKVPPLTSILAAADPALALWFDLKGVSPRLARRLRATIGDRPEVTASSKAWWLLPIVGRSGSVRTVRSAGNRFELALLRWLPSRAKIDGAVVNHRLLTDGTVDHLRRRGSVFTWGATSLAQVERLRSLGVDGVIVDDLDLIPARDTPLDADEDRGDPSR